MNTLKAGFSRVNITPCLGFEISGYYETRISDGVLDELELNALAVEAGGRRAVMIAVDNCGVGTEEMTSFRRHIAELTGLPMENVYMSSTHTHTGPYMRMHAENAMEQEYYRSVYNKIADAARMALEDMKPARMGYAIGKAEKIAFVRRFRMKDGKVRTNPGVGNPDIAHPIGDVDERVNVLRFDREGAESIVLVNFGNHPDVVGGCKISADWPGFLRRQVEKSIDNTRCLFFNGAQGDVNHVNVNAKDGDFNDMFNDFDDVARGYGHARHMGRVMAAAVMSVYDKVNYTDVDSIRALQKTIHIPSNKGTAEQLAQAKIYHALHLAGKDEEIPFKAMELTTVVAEANRMVMLENAPDAFDMNLNAVAIGNVVLFGVPGEPFTGVGRGLKLAKGWDMVMPCCNANGKEGYFPMKDAYDEGGYEARSSRFRAGAAELIIAEGTKLLDELHAMQ